MRIFIFVLAVVLVLSTHAEAQSFSADVHFTSAKWSEFDGNDIGVGGRLSWYPFSSVGVDADVTFYPRNFPPDTVAAFSNAYRFEGLFGATVGPRINRIRPFAKVAAGFLKVETNAAVFACIAIFPPPLACILAGGATLPAYEVGGGVSIDATPHTFIRADITQRLLKYPGPTFRGPGLGGRVDDDFFGGALRWSVGAGWRF